MHVNAVYLSTDVHKYVSPYLKHQRWEMERQNGSAHSVRPREHLKDKPVDVSCSVQRETSEG